MLFLTAIQNLIPTSPSKNLRCPGTISSCVWMEQTSPHWSIHCGQSTNSLDWKWQLTHYRKLPTHARSVPSSLLQQIEHLPTTWQPGKNQQEAHGAFSMHHHTFSMGTFTTTWTGNLKLTQKYNENVGRILSKPGLLFIPVQLILFTGSISRVQLFADLIP